MNAEFSRFLTEKSFGKKVILIGELHGTKEIPKLLTIFFSEYIKYNDFNICLELSSSNQDKIDRFIENGDLNIIKDIFSVQYENDGRKTLEYFELIKTIHNLNKKNNKNIRIICVDVEDNFYSDNFQNEREKIMATNILNSLEKQTFVILGNIHCSKKIINISDFKIIPTGYYIFKKLKNDVVNINLIPKKGKFYNLSIKEIALDSFSEFSKNYDFNYYLEFVTPATIMNEN